MPRRLRDDPNYDQAGYRAECHDPALYLVRESETGYLKVGRTNNMRMRLLNMQPGNPRKLEVIGLLPGRADFERSVQQRFAKFNISGEWFRPNPGLLSYFGVEESEGT